MQPLALLSAALAALAAPALAVPFCTTQGWTSQCFIAITVGDGSPAGAPANNTQSVQVNVVEYTALYSGGPTAAATAYTSGASLTVGGAFSLPGDYADRGTAQGYVKLDGTSCLTSNTLGATLPDVTCQGAPNTGTASLTPDNRFVVIGGYSMSAGLPIAAPGTASKSQKLQDPDANYLRSVGVFDLQAQTQAFNINVNSLLKVGGVQYPAEIYGATYWPNGTSDASSGNGVFYVTAGWGVGPTSTTTAATTATSAANVPLGIIAASGTAPSPGCGLAGQAACTAGLPSVGGLITVPVTNGVLSTMGSAGAPAIAGSGAGGSTYYLKYLRSPKVFFDKVYYVLNSKGVYVCSNGYNPATCTGTQVAQVAYGAVNTGTIDVRDFTWTGSGTLWVVEGQMGLMMFACTSITQICGTLYVAGTTAPYGEVYSTTPPNAKKWSSLLVNSSLMSVTSIVDQSTQTTIVLVAQPGAIWGWPSTNTGPYVNSVGNCCGNSNAAGTQCCWLNNNQPLATPALNTEFRGIVAPAVGGTTPGYVLPTATPSSTPSGTPSTTSTVSVTATPSSTISLSPSGSPSPTPSPSSSPSLSPTTSPSLSPSPTPTPTPSLSSGASASNTGSNSPTPSITGSPTFTPSPSRTATQTPTTTVSTSQTPSSSGTVTPTNTPTRTQTPTSTPTPSVSKGMTPPPPLLLSWAVAISLASATSSAQLTPAVFCDSVVTDALTVGFASVLNIPKRAVSILGITDAAGATTPITCSRRRRAGEAGGAALLAQLRAPSVDLRRGLAGSSLTVTIQASLGGSTSAKDWAQALALVTAPTCPALAALNAAVANVVGLTPPDISTYVDPAKAIKVSGGMAAPAAASNNAATSTVGGVLGGIIGAVFLFAGLATFRYYMVKGRLPPIFGRSTKTAAQKRSMTQLRNEADQLKKETERLKAESEEARSNPLASLSSKKKLSKEDSVKIAEALEDMDEEELAELKARKAAKAARKAAKAAAEAAAASEGESPLKVQRG